MIQDWKEYHGNKTFHIDGGGTLYPGTPQEKHIPLRIVKGPLKRPFCKICNEDLEKLRREEPKRRALNFCSIDCYNEAKELHKIWKKLKAETIWWTPKKPPIDKRTLTFTRHGESGIRHKYLGRKSRTKRNNTKESHNLWNS
jgi:hypothetical protein